MLDMTCVTTWDWGAVGTFAISLGSLGGLTMVVLMVALFALTVLFRGIECPDPDEHDAPHAETDRWERCWRDDLSID